MAVAFGQCVQVALFRQAEFEEFAVSAGTPEHGHGEGVFQLDHTAWPGRFAGADLGDGMARIDDPFNHDFNASATDLAAVQSRLDDAGVVEYQQVAGQNALQQITEVQVVQRIGLDMEQTAVRALTGGVLGDQFGRQVEVEIVEGQHTEFSPASFDVG